MVCFARLKERTRTGLIECPGFEFRGVEDAEPVCSGGRGEHPGIALEFRFLFGVLGVVLCGCSGELCDGLLAGVFF